MTTALKDYVKEIGKKESVCTMEHAGFKASLMRAKRLEGNEVFGLPPGKKIRVFPIATLPGSPEGWVREAGTYVVPVDKEWGLWFDWTMNDSLNTAIIPSVKGMNPITGRKLDGFGFEEYSDKCPVHNIALTHGNLCSECGYELPPQNYICSPNRLWWDGFRQADGSVRQFFFTDDDERDIASAVIGKENTVPAFGFACYKPKNPRTPPPSITRGGSTVFTAHTFFDSDMPIVKDELIYGSSTNNPSYVNISSCIRNKVVGYTGSTGLQGSRKSNKKMRFSGSLGVMKSSKGKRKNISSVKKSKSVSVGGGARINQILIRDDLGIDGWQDTPSATIRLYFCFEEQFRQIVRDGGVTEFKRGSDGYLEGLPLG